ncbi:MAG TPA: class I SAM-dependent methyltransferase [Polyangia bacterium]
MAPNATSSLYDAVAPIYDEWQAWEGMTPFAMVAAMKLAATLRREARRRARGEPAEPFAHLDLGCGTGTTLIELRRRHPGWRLAGVDGSRGMLAAARAKPTAGTIAWAQARLGDPLPCAARFDSCSILYDTLNHLTEPDGWTRALHAVAAALRPGGLLIFDVTNRIGFEKWWSTRNLFGGDDWDLSVAARFDRASGVGTADVALARPGGRATFRLTERLYEPEEIRALVEDAGFTVERRRPWAPFPRSDLGKTWWVARRS